MDEHLQAKLYRPISKPQPQPLPYKLHQFDDDHLELFFLVPAIGLSACYPSSIIPIVDSYYKFVYKDIFR
jgi:hypothetical protein